MLPHEVELSLGMWKYVVLIIGKVTNSIVRREWDRYASIPWVVETVAMVSFGPRFRCLVSPKEKV